MDDVRDLEKCMNLVIRIIRDHADLQKTEEEKVIFTTEILVNLVANHLYKLTDINVTGNIQDNIESFRLCLYEWFDDLINDLNLSKKSTKQ